MWIAYMRWLPLCPPACCPPLHAASPCAMCPSTCCLPRYALHSHAPLTTCACCHDQTKGAQDKDCCQESGRRGVRAATDKAAAAGALEAAKAAPTAAEALADADEIAAAGKALGDAEANQCALVSVVGGAEADTANRLERCLMAAKHAAKQVCCG